mmetsp:Transcript_541/g.1381  ORF Transcript_541/g.1381 Transcript_541/m.1381 type:complete len:220 (+) Transcript_541:1551-2210(+)
MQIAAMMTHRRHQRLPLPAAAPRGGRRRSQRCAKMPRDRDQAAAAGRSPERRTRRRQRTGTKLRIRTKTRNEKKRRVTGRRREIGQEKKTRTGIAQGTGIAMGIGAMIATGVGIEPRTVTRRGSARRTKSAPVIGKEHVRGKRRRNGRKRKKKKKRRRKTGTATRTRIRIGREVTGVIAAQCRREEAAVHREGLRGDSTSVCHKEGHWLWQTSLRRPWP